MSPTPKVGHIVASPVLLEGGLFLKGGTFLVPRVYACNISSPLGGRDIVGQKRT